MTTERRRRYDPNQGASTSNRVLSSNRSVTPMSHETSTTTDTAPGPLTREHMDYLKSRQTIQNFTKGDLICDGRTRLGHYFQIIQGGVRAYTLMDDEERTIDFYLAGDAFQVSPELNDSLPVVIYQCLQNTTVSETTAADEQAFFQAFPEVKQVCLQETESRLAKQQADFLRFKASTPEARYRDLCEQRPAIIANVPKYLIADYLGIQPESFSRLVKRLKTSE